MIIASRNADRGESAISKIKSEYLQSGVRFEVLDLASIEGVESFSERMRAELSMLHLLINNAGIMTPPKRQTFANGFEVQIGVNFLGHFALTAGLLPLLRNENDPRIVTMRSIASREGFIDFDDLQSERTYRPMSAYAQSKLADLRFALELQKRSDVGNWNVVSFAAHPGLSRTNLFTSGPGAFGKVGFIRKVMGPILFQSSARGALPALFAATSPDAQGGSYYGPNHLEEIRGNVDLPSVPPQANDAEVAAHLWDVAEQLTGVSFP